MDQTYTMIGADGQQYGPITLEQLKTWVKEERVTATTKIKRSDVDTWLTAAQYVELGIAAPPAVATAPGPRPVSVAMTASAAALERQMKSGAGWFFFIAGLSLINSLAVMSGGSFHFVLGLGVTQVLDGMGAEMGKAGPMIGLALDLVVLGIFVMCGVFARKGQGWGFILGMVLYGLDLALLLVLAAFGAADWFSIGFHAFALFRIFSGWQSANQLKALAQGSAA